MIYSSPTIAQIIITTNTPGALTNSTAIAITGDLTNNSSTFDLSRADLSLLSVATQTLTTSTPIILDGLTINGGNYTIAGQWTIATNLTLTKGNLVVNAANGKLIYTGATDLNQLSDNSFVDGLFFMQGTGVRTFPIGTGGKSYPVALDGVKDNKVLLGFEVVTGDPGYTKAPLPLQASDVFNLHYWNLIIDTSPGGSFAGSSISLSVNGFDSWNSHGGDPIILQSDGTTVTNLGGDRSNPFVLSQTDASPSAKSFALAHSETVTVKIYNIITPNKSDDKNNVLFIDNIDFYPDNKVYMIDRWGVPVHEWTNFKNYTSTDPSQSDFDFTSLAIGNYICAVEYTDTKTGKRIKVKPQMISVLK